jgi:imidazolonepropionase-like amidohydrolase
MRGLSPCQKQPSCIAIKDDSAPQTAYWGGRKRSPAMTNQTTLIIALLALISADAATAEQPAGPPAATVITNVDVISAHLDQVQTNRDVFIKNGKLCAIVPAGTVGNMCQVSDYQVIGGSGKFLIPGLIDSHVHLGHNPIINRSEAQEYEHLIDGYKRQLPRSYLYHGFTSLIDLDYSAERNAWPADAEHVPSVYHCGRGVRVAGGYGPAFVPPHIAHRVFPNLVYEDSHKDTWPAELDPAAYTVKAAVDRVRKSGAICLKTYVESGFGGTFDWPVPSAEILLQLAAEAHNHGLVFVVHANSADAWNSAVDAGADVIAHGMWHWEGARTDPNLTGSARLAISAAANAGVAVQPTMRVIEGERSTLTWDLLDDDRLEHVLSRDLRSFLESDEGRWSQRGIIELYQEHNPDPQITPASLIESSINRASASMAEFHAIGGKLLFGTDTPAQDGPGNPPGLNGYLELESWARAGIPLAEIFRSATVENARMFGLEDRIGTIEAGKQADLVLLNSNPLQDVKAYNDISLVILNGEPIERRDLSADD